MSTVGIESTHPKTMPEAHATLPVWNAENWFYEDFAIGHKIRSLRRTISEGESMQFNALVLDMHPYVGDQIFAETEGLFGRRLVAGAFVFSAGLGLVATNCVNAFSYGYDRLRFIKPVFIGDTTNTGGRLAATAARWLHAVSGGGIAAHQPGGNKPGAGGEGHCRSQRPLREEFSVAAAPRRTQAVLQRSQTFPSSWSGQTRPSIDL